MTQFNPRQETHPQWIQLYNLDTNSEQVAYMSF